MTDDERDDLPPEPVTPEPRTLCPTCQGMGVISEPKAAAAGGVGRTLTTVGNCSQCHGEKFLPGLQPPM